MHVVIIKGVHPEAGRKPGEINAFYKHNRAFILESYLNLFNNCGYKA